jgi:hypothetical protein
METIQILFFTDNLDQRKYTDAILEFIFSHFRNKKQYDKIVETNKWIVNIFSSKDAKYNFDGVNGVLNYGVPHGITNKNTRTVDVYVPDLSGDYAMIQNFMTISHELSHMMLAIFYPDKREKYRHTSKSWGRKGDIGNFYVTEVHDREYEMAKHSKWIRKISIYKWLFFGKNIGKLELPCFDITDLTSQ